MSDGNFSAAEVESMLVSVAKLIDVHGEALLPLFEMLETELEKAQRKDSSLARARRLARASAP